MQIEKLLEEQEKEFVKKYNSSVLLAYPEYAESHMILLTDIWNWHKQSLKQFIDGLVAHEQEYVDVINKNDNGTKYEEGYRDSKETNISHLKEIRAKLV